MSSTGRRTIPLANAALSLVPAMAGSFSIADEIVVVRLGGSLMDASRATVRIHLLRLVEPDGPREIVLDLSRVSSVDAAGMRPLLEAHRLQVARGGGLRIGAISRAVAVHLFAEQAVADLLMPQFGIDQPQHWAAEARWFDAGVGTGRDEGS